MSVERDEAALDELLGAFALDAVDADEAEAVARHLQRSPRARAEVAAHREVAALLVAAGGDAPEGVWGQIQQRLGESPAARDAPRLDAAVRPIGSARSARRSVPLRAAAPIVGAAAALVAVLGVQVARQGDELDEQHVALAEQQQELAQLDRRLAERDLSLLAASATTDPTNRVTVLSAEDRDLTATAVMGDDGQGFLLAEGLPQLRDGRSYQLWGIVGERTVSLGLLDAPGVIGFHVDGPMDGYAITEEIRGGVARSEQTPLVVGLTDAR